VLFVATVTLSFDNGPEPDVTPDVLDVLARHGLKATFFVIGEKLAVPGRRSLSERAAAEGHWIGNHTWTHSVPLGQREDRDGAVAEVGRTQAEIGALSHPDRLFRPFGGGGHIGPLLLNRRVVDHLTQGGFSCVLWNAIPRDFADPDGWVDTALGQCAAQDWTVVVLHDLPNGAMRHLDAFLSRATEAGHSFRQDFPDACVPIRRGEIRTAIEGIMAPA
jgi:peptidoglycan/xylan/chitin deacetylase (PgdA/CDA1 family)